MSQPTNATDKLPFDPFSHFERIASSYSETSSAMNDVAAHLLTLSPPLTSTSVIHDNACGPGIVTGEILSLPQFSPTKTPSAFPTPTIHATDYSPSMIRALSARAVHENWPTATLHPQVMDSMSLTGIPSNTITHSYTAAAIFIISDPVAAIAEIHRTLKPAGEGVALVTSFEKQGFIEIFQEAQRAIRPEAPIWKGPLPEEWRTEEKLRDVMVGGGFESDKVEIKRFSVWLDGEVWAKPGTAALRESFTRQCTLGWSEEERERFEERLRADLERIMEEKKRYEMGVFCAVGSK